LWYENCESAQSGAAGEVGHAVVTQAGVHGIVQAAHLRCRVCMRMFSETDPACGVRRWPSVRPFEPLTEVANSPLISARL